MIGQVLATMLEPDETADKLKSATPGTNGATG
jgi:hypothetical protein